MVCGTGLRALVCKAHRDGDDSESESESESFYSITTFIGGMSPPLQIRQVARLMEHDMQPARSLRFSPRILENVFVANENSFVPRAEGPCFLEFPYATFRFPFGTFVLTTKVEI